MDGFKLIKTTFNKQKEFIGVKFNGVDDYNLFVREVKKTYYIFPNEVKETYYVPFIKGHIAKGKLFDAYNNTRARLSAAGVIKRRLKHKPQEVHTEEILSFSDIEDSDLEILKNGNADWDLISTTWSKTHSFRQKELQDENFKTIEYFDKYKVVLNENNYELFNIDYQILHPSSKSIYQWKLYYNKIIAKAEKLKDNSVYDILNNIKNTDEEDSKLALSLMLVPYLLPGCRQRSKLEIQETFISYCKNILVADDEIRNRLKRPKIESQPKIILIGDSIKTISLAFVDICGKRLKFENPIKAIEVCFHCLIGMNIKYPKYCAHVWIFVQKLIFQINTPWDTTIPAVNTMINDLNLDME